MQSQNSILARVLSLIVVVNLVLAVVPTPIEKFELYGTLEKEGKKERKSEEKGKEKQKESTSESFKLLPKFLWHHPANDTASSNTLPARGMAYTNLHGQGLFLVIQRLVFY